MSSFRIFETNEFQKKFSKLPSDNQAFIQKKLSHFIYPQLKREPYFGNNIKKLKGYSPDTWRYRIGKFRIFYSIDHKQNIIYILTIDFCKDAYRQN